MPDRLSLFDPNEVIYLDRLSVNSSEMTSDKRVTAKVSAVPLLSGHKSLCHFFSSSPYDGIHHIMKIFRYQSSDFCTDDNGGVHFIGMGYLGYQAALTDDLAGLRGLPFAGFHQQDASGSQPLRRR